MKVKNNSNNLIQIGILNLLPGQTAILPVPYENHPIVKMLAVKRYITLVKDAKDGKKPYTISQMKRFSRQELEEIAIEFGITTDAVSKNKLVEAIFVAQETENI